jgi:hypothetical protein
MEHCNEGSLVARRLGVLKLAYIADPLTRANVQMRNYPLVRTLTR